ncbi:MAG: tRNA (guanosine(37)-N1)-methyltransferase TrmD [Proteobacteria bacterium]|nr:tRNA (guanosine(37)-N1)-methyltransferase TrmD [Pseudomonadota bacterium]
MTWRLAFISIHPKLIEAYKSLGVFKAAENAALAEIQVIDLRNYAADRHATVDGAPYGGGDGMVMRADCLERAVEGIATLWGEKPNVVFTTPSGRLWRQEDARQFAVALKPTVFVCGRFAGIDQRFIERHVTHEYSVGDIVLAGGELPSMMIVESSLRLIPGVLGNDQSATDDSFSEGLSGLLEYPSFTRPSSWQGLEVPKVLLSGNHEEIKLWRQNQSNERTKKLRPDLWEKHKLENKG